MAPHLLENTRIRLGNGRPHELDPAIRIRFLSWRPGLEVASPPLIARNPLISPESRKLFATFGNEWKFFEAAAERN